MKKRRNIYLAIITLITIILWVVVGVFNSYQQTTVTPDVVKAIAPLDPVIDGSVFNRLENRQESEKVNP